MVPLVAEPVAWAENEPAPQTQNDKPNLEMQKTIDTDFQEVAPQKERKHKWKPKVKKKSVKDKLAALLG